MAITYDVISSTTLTSTATTVNFTSIPQTYTDLVLIISLTGVSNSNTVSMRLGNTSIDTGSNYSSNWMRGNGSAGSAGGNNSSTYIMLNTGDVSANNTNGLSISNLQGYTGTNDKQIITRWSQNQTSTSLLTSQWRSSSSPIKLIELFLNTSKTYTFSIGSTFSLYGIKAA
jgi:hypothetical protein